MRNLKRALSLALASVMLLGMMVVGTSAASYPDVDENDNVEAIEVLNAVNVMIGRQGNFEPDEAVNRHEMAVIMAKLVLGVDTADNYVGTHPFTDVVPWADKYVAACYENGLVLGTSATTYGGGSPLTAVQAAAMMLRALGYKDLNKGYQGDWRAPITAMANQIRLFSGVASNPNEKLNRNQVAQLALNTLKSPMVNLKDGTFTATDGNGQLIISGGSREYIVLSSQEAYARAINDVESKGTSASAIGGYTVELGEHLYNGKLKLNNKDIDVFGRPSRTWEYDGKKIGSYIKEELMVKNDEGKVTGVDLYNLLGSSTIKEYTLDVYVDGVNDPAEYNAITGAVDDRPTNTSVVFNKTDLNRNNKAGIGATGTGVLMQVFVDHEDKVIYVAVINTYLAIADKAYDEKKEEASIKVYDLTKDATKAVYAKTPQSPASEQSVTFKLGNEDFALVKDIAKNDPYLVTVADGAIQTIVPAEVISNATISAFKRNDHVVSGGTTYKYTTTAGYNFKDLYIYTSENNITQNLKDITYNIYLDQYGNLIGLKADSSPKNYVFLTSIDRNGSYISNKTATASAIFPDGTVDTISINMTKSEWVPTNRPDGGTGDENFNHVGGASLLNTWCTYTKSGDVYTVKEVWNNYNEHTGAWDNTRTPTANGTDLAQFNTIKTATPATQITLKNGLRLRTGYAIGSSYANVYGDSDSVYLTAELGKVVNEGNHGVIKGVEGLFKGIDGTDITVWNTAKAEQEAKVAAGDPVSEGVYTLYDDEGIVIASVIVGEGSSAKDLVYVISDDLSLEEDNGGNAKAAGDGKWTFYREVVRNGEKVMLTEVGESVNALSARNMKQNTWYQVKTNGDGNVTSATPACVALDDWDTDAAPGKDVFVDDYADINTAVEYPGMDAVLYHTNGGPNADLKEAGEGYGYDHDGFDGLRKLRVEGNNVLAVDTMQGSGIYFRSDVNVVLTYYNRNTNQTEVIIDTGVDAVKDAVKFVNDNTSKCAAKNGASVGRLDDEDFFVSALIQNGAATTIVIQDRYNDYSRPEDTTQYNQKLYLAGRLGNNGLYTTNTQVYTVNADGRQAVQVDTDWNDWRNNVVRYTIKSGETVQIYDPDISSSTPSVYYPEFDSKVAINPSDWDITGNWLTFTMPKSDVTIRDGVAPAGISTSVDLTGAPVGPNGAEFTYDVYDDESATLTGMSPKAEKVKVATMTITLDADGKVTDVKIVPVSATAEKVIKVTIKTGANSSDVTITNNAAQPKDVAVEAPKYVAKATVVDGKITEIEYNDDKLAAGESLPIVDEKGNPVTGTVAKADDANETISVEGATIADGATITDGETPKDLSTDGTVGDEVATFDVTLEYDETKVTVTTDPETITGLTGSTEITLTVAVKDAETDEIKSVKAGTQTLVAEEDGTYKFTATEAVTVTVETQAKGSGKVGDLPDPKVDTTEDTITGYWYGGNAAADATPSDEDFQAVVANVKNDAAFAGATTVMLNSAKTSIIVDGCTTAANNGTYPLTMKRLQKITIDKDTYYAGETAGTVTAYGVETAIEGNFITEGLLIADNAITVGEPSEAGEATLANLTTLTKDITLVSGYTIAKGTGVASVTVGGNGLTADAASKVVPAGTELTVVTSTGMAGKFVQLSANTVKKGTEPVLSTSDAYTFTYEVLATDLGDSANITLSVASGYKVMVGTDYLGIVDAATGMAVVADNNNVIKTGDILIVDDAEAPVVEDTDANKAVVTYTGTETAQSWTLTFQTGFNKATAANEGVITLVKAMPVAVTVADVTVKVGESNDLVDSHDKLLAAVGSTLTVTSKTPSAKAGDKVTVTINGETVATGEAGAANAAATLDYEVLGTETHAITFVVLKKVENLTIASDSNVAAGAALSISFGSGSNTKTPAYSVTGALTDNTAYTGDKAITVTVEPDDGYYIPDDITVTGTKITTGNVVVTVVEGSTSVNATTGKLTFKISFTLGTPA